ncbi:hypothetical protein CK203_004147 [Vitis vinifera]|uniref:Uncharacterized protein n=1 Tax=Vitis vinifera TaxID=29760 RepID=A0A438K9Y9_VITVI|nr:hypothetical protein CK203_004147 [Vitis vinifera]
MIPHTPSCNSANTYWASECPRHRRYGPSACPEIFCNIVRLLLVVCLGCLNGVASRGFCDRRVDLHMYRQKYGFFDGEGGSYAAKASARPFSVRLIFSIVHSMNRCKPNDLLQMFPVGDCSRSLHRIRMIHEVSHYLAFHGQLGWNSIPNSLNSIAHCSILPVKSGLCRMLRRGCQLARPPGGLGNRGGASGQRFEGLRLLAPFLNTWFLRPPMLC